MKNEKRQYALDGFNLCDLVDESIAFLRKNEPEEGYYVGFSGGKDSIVTLELCRMAGVKHDTHYSVTRIDHPKIIRFIREYYPDVVFDYPKMTFWKGIEKHGIPSIKRRWCCEVLKEGHGKRRSKVLGIRAEESSARANRGRISKNGNSLNYKPIFTWKEWAVWQFIEEHKLEYPSLYDEGYNRIGCIICPFQPHKERMKSIKRYPLMWRIFKKKCLEYNCGRSSDFFNKFWHEAANL